MPTNIEYVLMADHGTHTDDNRFPIPNGWVVLPHRIKELEFEAVAFKRKNEIVISFATRHTHQPDLPHKHHTEASDINQRMLLAAALYYVQLKKLNLGAVITLTGQHLGGGIVTLLAELFHVPAITFDPVPPPLKANDELRTRLRSDLANLGYPVEARAILRTIASNKFRDDYPQFVQEASEVRQDLAHVTFLNSMHLLKTESTKWQRVPEDDSEFNDWLVTHDKEKAEVDKHLKQAIWTMLVEDMV